MPKSDQPLPLPTIESSETVLTGFIHLQRDTLLLPNGGRHLHYTLTTRPQSVVVLALTRQGEFVLTEEYRHSAGRVLLGLPGGFLDGEETPNEGGRRELLEETGYTAETFETIGSAYPMPGVVHQKAYFVLGQSAHPVASPSLEQAEIIRSVLKTESEIVDDVRRGKEIDSHLCTALYFFKNWVERKR